jgi:hypothetical protein
VKEKFAMCIDFLIYKIHEQVLQWWQGGKKIMHTWKEGGEGGAALAEYFMYRKKEEVECVGENWA